MKRFSQTLKVLLAMVVATFGTSIVPTAAVYAIGTEEAPIAEAQAEATPQAASPSSTVVDNGEVDAQGTPLDDETDTTPSEPTDTTTDATPKSDDEDVVVDEKEATKDIVKTLLSPDTTQRQSSIAAAVVTVKKVTFCHATPPEDAKNGWNKLDTAVEVVFNAGHDSEHPADIIPPFYYEKQGETLYFAGLNWDEEGEAIFENDCVDENVVIEEPFLQTYYDATVCGQVTVSLRNASPWMYRVLIEKSQDGVSWERANGSVSGAGIQANVITGGVLEVNNLGASVPDDRTGHYTVTFAEDSGTYELRYKVSSGTEGDLYLPLPVGQYTYIPNIVSDCIDNPVVPTAPSIVDLCYDDRDGIFVVSNTKGVKYYVDGNKVHGWTWVPFTGEPIEVTAEARDGYEIPEDVTSSWTYTSEDFTDEQCLTITKSAKVASDINLDGIINVGDTVTWTITVTNTSDEDYEAFKVVVTDPAAELEGNGFIKFLGAGKSKTLPLPAQLQPMTLKPVKL